MFVSGENSNKQLFMDQSNNGFFGDQCISPPKKVDFDVSKIKSFSSYSDHSVWINNDGKAFAIGNNSRSQINNASYGKFYEKPTQIKIDGFTFSDKEYFVSVVCGDNYTLYMTSTGRLIYMHEKGEGNPLFLKLKIPNPKSTTKSTKSNDKFIYRKPLGLFGGCTRAAVIDEEGDFYIITEELFNSKNSTPKYYSLPESVTNVACCDTFLVALTCSGKVYGNGQINEDNDEFIEIEEISEFGPFTQISGTYEHCLALNKEGRVYGFGSNYKGRLSLDSEMRTVDTFVLLSAFDDLKVYGISAGFNHSLFLMKEKELASCGTNSYGELLAIKPTKDCYFTPIKTKIIAETKIPYFIAGCNTSFAFVDCDAPPNCPNKNIELSKKRLIRQKSERNDPSDLTSSVRKKIEDSRSKTTNKYSSKDKNNKTEEEENINESNKNNESNNNSEEIKALKAKIEELDTALKKSEEEKAIIIKKLLEVTQIADQLHNVNNDLTARVLKYELTLGLLAAVANASGDSDENSEKKDEDEEKEKQQKEKEEKEKKEKERIEKEKREKIRKEKERREKERKKKQQEAKQNPPDDENKEKQKQTDQKDQQPKKHKQDSKQKSSEDENKQKHKDQQQKKVQQKSNEDENKQKQKSNEDENKVKQKQKDQQQQKKAQQKTNEDESKSNQKQKQTDQKDQQQKKVPQKSNEAESKSNQKSNEDESKVKQKQKDQQQQKKVQQKSSEDENKPKQKQADQQQQQQKKAQQKSNEAENKSNQKVQQPEEPEQDEESSKHRHHRHHKNSPEKQQQENQQKKNPKEPSENINDKDQEQNRKHAPRRKHRHQENNEDSNNQSQKISTPPSILTQKENEQKKSIIKPTVSKPNNKFT